MPRYDYACTACDHRFEAVQSFADDPLTECPVCGGRLRKLISPVGVVFKGSGFYRNDSRKLDTSANGDREPAKATAQSDSKPGSESKSDSSGPDKDAGKSESSSGSKGGSTSDGKAPAATTTPTTKPTAKGAPSTTSKSA